MNMQQMVIAMQKMQKEYAKKQAAIEAKDFEYIANSAIKVILKGNRKIVSIEFLDEDILEKDNKEMISDMIVMATNNCIEQIEKEEENLANEFQKMNRGMPF